MAYFSNGTEGASYEEQYCSRCVHRNGPDGTTGCAVWLAHILHSYDLCNKDEDPGKQILDLLIPMSERGFAEQCSMFHEGEPVPDPEEHQGEMYPRDVLPSMRQWAMERGIIRKI